MVQRIFYALSMSKEPFGLCLFHYKNRKIVLNFLKFLKSSLMFQGPYDKLRLVEYFLRLDLKIGQGSFHVFICYLEGAFL